MNILLVDDHPMTIEGYLGTLLKAYPANSSRYFKANNCEEAYNILEKNATLQNHLDLAIIDFGLPAFAEKNIFSGGDLAITIRKFFPECRIIMITGHTEVIIIYDIAKKIRPEGLIVKNDVTPENLLIAAKSVLDGETFQSPIVKNCISEIWKKQLMVDDTNRQILVYLSKGFKVMELEGHVHLTTSAIQKRIVFMKKAFDVNDNNGLIKIAIIQGFL